MVHTTLSCMVTPVTIHYPRILYQWIRAVRTSLFACFLVFLNFCVSFRMVSITVFKFSHLFIYNIKPSISPSDTVVFVSLTQVWVLLTPSLLCLTSVSASGSLNTWGEVVTTSLMSCLRVPPSSHSTISFP